jgi:hypothetical protein
MTRSPTLYSFIANWATDSGRSRSFPTSNGRWLARAIPSVCLRRFGRVGLFSRSSVLNGSPYAGRESRPGSISRTTWCAGNSSKPCRHRSRLSPCCSDERRRLATKIAERSGLAVRTAATASDAGDGIYKVDLKSWQWQGTLSAGNEEARQLTWQATTNAVPARFLLLRAAADFDVRLDWTWRPSLVFRGARAARRANARQGDGDGGGRLPRPDEAPTGEVQASARTIRRLAERESKTDLARWPRLHVAQPRRCV